MEETKAPTRVERATLRNPFAMRDAPDGNGLGWGEGEKSCSSLTVNFGEREYRLDVWHPGVGVLGAHVSLDTETESLDRENHPDKIPRFVLGQAYGGGDTVYFIGKEHLKAFLDAHSSSALVFHNSPFDFAVLKQEVKFDPHPRIESGQVYDTGILYRLHLLATAEKYKREWSLDFVCKQILGIEISKDESVRNTFGQFRQGETVFYSKISEKHLRYAAIDCLATFQLFEQLYGKVHSLDPENLLTHQIQLKGFYALDAISRRGIGFDLSKKEKFLVALDRAIESDLATLATYEYYPGRQGVRADFQRILLEEEVYPPVRDDGKFSEKTEDLDPYRRESPFIDAFLSHKANGKLRATFLDHYQKARIHTRYDFLLQTGRTSSFSPNLQNLPRQGGVRECFIPKPGHCFLIADYKTAELRSLAQVCLKRYGGYSKMAEIINAGTDIHEWFAMQITGKSKIEKEDRKKAKACNFGIPGGLGASTLARYALTNYGIAMTEEDAKALKEAWLNAFPEMRLYLDDSILSRHNFSSASFFCPNVEQAKGLWRKMVRGVRVNNQGKPYSRRVREWAFKTVMKDIAPQFVGIGYSSPEIYDKIFRESVSTLTGRIRANATYCQVRNTPFQGLAADGSKLALYELEKAGFQIVNHIHDENIIELPISESTVSMAKRVEEFMIAGMKEVIPDVEIGVDWHLSMCWDKAAELVKDAEGQIAIHGGWNEDGTPRIISLSSQV